MTTELKPRVWHKCINCNCFLDDFREGDDLEGYVTHCCWSLAPQVLVLATPQEIKEYDLDEVNPHLYPHL